MSDEEKKAIEVIKGLAVYYDDYSLLDEEEIEENEEVNNSINIVINLIEKQSKEIEELKEKYEKIYNDIINKIEELEKLDFGTDSVSQFTANLTTITILQSLLEKE